MPPLKSKDFSIEVSELPVIGSRSGRASDVICCIRKVCDVSVDNVIGGGYDSLYATLVYVLENNVYLVVAGNTSSSLTLPALAAGYTTGSVYNSVSCSSSPFRL
jgi:hypothetical protein